MKYDVSIKSNAAVISFEGLFSIEKMKYTAPQIRDKVSKCGITGFVLDFTAVSDSVGIIDAFEFIRAVNEFCGDYRKVAIVRGGGPTEGECFCAEIGRFKGVCFQTFLDVAEAVEWLGKEKIM